MLIAVVVALVVPAGLAWLGLTEALGAHPFWSFKVALIGAPVGCVLGLVLPVGRKLRLGAALVVLIVAAAAAYWGKIGFVTSYAEDALAGKFWYFGWIGIAAGLALLLFALLAPARRGG